MYQRDLQKHTTVVTVAPIAIKKCDGCGVAKPVSEFTCTRVWCHKCCGEYMIENAEMLAGAEYKLVGKYTRG